jgi:hypothetical protein
MGRRRLLKNGNNRLKNVPQLTHKTPITGDSGIADIQMILR